MEECSLQFLISSHLLHLPSLSTDCEIMWAKLIISASPLYIAAYYRPHINDEYSLTQLDLSLHQLNETTNNPTILLSGNFNLPGIDWSENLVKHSSPFKAIHEYSLEILQDHGLQQPVIFSTCNFNTLGLVSSNKPSTILNIQSIAGISDHDIVCFEVNANLVDHTRQIPRSIYMYNRANWNAPKEELYTLLVKHHFSGRASSLKPEKVLVLHQSYKEGKYQYTCTEMRWH